MASLLAQYFRHRKGISARCIDADPVNQTLAQYSELGAERLDLMREGSVDQRAFDGLMESLLTESGTFIVDNGASTFIPLWNYMLENNAVALLKSSGRRIFLHCVLTGGQALADTLSGFARLAQTTAERNIVLWVNEYFGRVERDGRALSELPVYIEHASSVAGSVAIPRRNQDTFGRDVEDVIARKLTLQEAIDVERLLTEALTKHGIRLDLDDPAMVLITLNRLVLEDAVECVAANIRKATREYEEAANRVQSRLGAAIAMRLKTRAGVGAYPGVWGRWACLVLGMAASVGLFLIGIAAGRWVLR